MDFEVTYTPEQEAFRTEVRAWLAANIPEGLEQPVDRGIYRSHNTRNCANWAAGWARKAGSTLRIPKNMGAETSASILS
jgi:hypothetical protein